MAQLTTSSGKRARHQIRMDMTPMVDLAFLLLTFFVLTMTLNKKFVMPLDRPMDDGNHQQPVNIKRVLTLVIGQDSKIYYFEGDDAEVRLTNFSKNGVREVLLNASKRIEKLVVLIKPSKESKYKNMIDILDEIQITHIDHYYIVKETQADRELIASSQL